MPYINEQTIDWYGPASGVELWIYVTKAFVRATGVPVNASSPWDDRTRAYPWIKVSCDINSDEHTNTLERFYLPPTENAITGEDTTLIAMFMDVSGAVPRMILGYSVFGGEGPSVSFRSPRDQDFPSTTWAGLAAHMRGEAYTDSGSLIPLIFRDEFSSGAAAAGRRPTVSRNGSVWEPSAGTFSVNASSGYMAPSADYSDGALILIDAGTSDFTLYGVLTGFHTGGGANKSMPGLAFRAADANNKWVVNLDSFTGAVKLYEFTGGTPVERGSVMPGLASGAEYPVSVNVVGPVITVDVSGQDPFTYESTQHMTATKVGFRAGGVGVPGSPPRVAEFSVIPAFVLGEDPLIQSAPDSWRSVDVAAPSTVYDAAIARYVMAGSGFDGELWRSGRWTALAPLGEFTEDPTNPTFEPDVDVEGYIGASDGVAIKDGIHYAVYQGAPGVTAEDNSGHWRIYAKRSLDQGRTWERLNGGAPILPLGAPGSFDADGHHDGHLVLLDNGWFEINFSGRNGSVFTAGRSLALDLENCGPTSALQVFGRLGGTASVGNVARFGTDPLTYTYFFTRSDSGEARHICMSYTTDGGANFNYLGGVLYGQGTWASAQVFDPDPLPPVGNKLYLYVGGGTNAGGVEDLNSSIGVAVCEIP